jgi:hypothetical protein
VGRVSVRDAGPLNRGKGVGRDNDHKGIDERERVWLRGHERLD